MKVVPKTIMARQETKFKSFHIWGCLTKARYYNPYEKKVDPKAIIDYFINYPKCTKKYKFHCPYHYTRIIELAQ